MCALAAALVLTARSARTDAARRRARDLLDSAEAGRDHPSPAALAEAIGIAERCRRQTPRPLRRAALDHWESRLRRPLPRLWIVGPDAAAQLARHEPSPPPDPPDEPILIPAHLRSVDIPKLVVLAACVAAWLALDTLTTRHAISRVGITLAVAAFGLGVFAATVWLLGSSGWWLQLHNRRMRLIRLSRRGRERIAYDIDPADTFAVIWPAADHVTLSGEPPGDVGWRILPPRPIPAFEVYDVDPRLTPWADAIADACAAADPRA